MSKDKKFKEWNEVFKLPLHQDIISWVSDANGNMLFQFIITGEELRQKVLDTINGDYNVTKKTSKYIYKDGFIQTEQGVKLILMRGWGLLIGSGGFGLDANEAAYIQNGFAEYIVSRLNPENVELTV